MRRGAHIASPDFSCSIVKAGASMESKILGLKSSLEKSESHRKKIELLSARVRTVETLLGYLKSKARIMAIPRYAFASCGIRRKDGVGFVDKKGIPMADWMNQANFQGAEKQLGLDELVSSLEGGAPHLIEKEDADYVERTAVAVTQVTDVMEVLLKRALVAEAEVDLEREKARISGEEVRKKSIQIERMWTRVEEMERVAVGTGGILKEMQVKLEDMEQETSRQRQRANENEQELSKVRHDFGVLRSSVDSLVKARETIRSMESRIQEVEKISERLTARVGGLEAGKRDSEAETKRLLLENDNLRGQLDLKEAELAAVSDQVKMLVMRS